jgi:hypothetical protein
MFATRSPSDHIGGRRQQRIRGGDRWQHARGRWSGVAALTRTFARIERKPV